MIAENEIRIGNWFKHNSDWSYRNEECIEFDFEWEYSDWYALGECTLNLNNISPIPLTEEWLLRFDFDKYNLGFWCSRDALYFEYGNGRSVEIKYVHTLQNIYHSLTNQELTLKEKV